MLSAAPERRLTLTSLGGEPLTLLPLVPRLSLRGSLPASAEDLWLLRGGASKQEIGQIVAAAPSESLLGKRIPLSVWTSDGAFVLAPAVVLEPSQEYTLVALTLGELG